MEENELKAILEQLRAEGWQPMLCDTDLPFYDKTVPCGEPLMAGEDAPDSILWPRDLLSMHPEFTVVIKGDSMMDAGLAYYGDGSCDPFGVLKQGLLGKEMYLNEERINDKLHSGTDYCVQREKQPYCVL